MLEYYLLYTSIPRRGMENCAVLPQYTVRKESGTENSFTYNLHWSKTIKDERKSREQLTGELKDLRRQLAASQSRRILSMESYDAQTSEGLLIGKRTKADDEGAKTEGIIAAIGDGLRIIDTDFRIVYENQVHKRLLGDHAGEYCYSAYRQRDGECEMCPLVSTLEEGLTHKTERTLSADTETRHLGITASPLRDASGRIIAAVVIVRDITGRKRIEQEREKLIAELHEAMAKIKTLRGLIPTCAWCRKVRDDKGNWYKMEHYVRKNSYADFTHGICPECFKKTWPEYELPSKGEKD
jgi:PAS domain S-box-containing protein